MAVPAANMQQHILNAFGWQERMQVKLGKLN